MFSGATSCQLSRPGDSEFASRCSTATVIQCSEQTLGGAEFGF